jgi:hypothetical protein
VEAHHLAHLFSPAQLRVGNENIPACGISRFHIWPRVLLKTLLTRNNGKNIVQVMGKFAPQFFTQVQC